MSAFCWLFTQPNANRVENGKDIFCGAVSPLILKSKRPANSVQQTSGGAKNLLHGYPLLDEKGEVELIVTFIRDISHLTLFKEQMAYHKDILGRFQSDGRSIEPRQTNDSPFVAESLTMNTVLAQVKKIAQTDATVLILGDTGVGKGEIARQIHAESKRADNIFFKADCTSIPESLVESELFGYAPGAFTGARRTGKPGYFEMAANGTIFLDEIGELPTPMQSKLLRVLQDQEIMQVGSLNPQKVNTRIIAATNMNLEAAVADGRFRQDLYYRLHVSVLHIPPLHQRVEDILPLASFFLQRYNNKYRKRLTFTDETLEILLKYKWPGNIRELQNTIQGLVITSDKHRIEPSDLPQFMTKQVTGQNLPDFDMLNAKNSGKSLKEIVSGIELQILQKALKEYGSMSKVAKFFRVNRTTVSRKLQSAESTKSEK